MDDKIKNNEDHTKKINTEILQKSLEDFKRSVEITRDVRFQANLRLSSRQRRSSYFVSMLSLYVIGISLIPNVLSLIRYQNQILLSCSIILSVFVIFTSLIDGSQNFYHRGELLHQCARKIADIHRKLKNIDVDASPSTALDQLKSLQDKYQAALDECPTNHDNVDYWKEISWKPYLFPEHYKNKCPHLIKSYYNLKAWFFGNFWMFWPIFAVIAVSFVIVFFIFMKLP